MKARLLWNGLAIAAIVLLYYLAVTIGWSAVAPSTAPAAPGPAPTVYSPSKSLMDAIATLLVPPLSALLLPAVAGSRGWRLLWALATRSWLAGLIAYGCGLGAALALARFEGHGLLPHIGLAVLMALIMPLLLLPANLYISRSARPLRLHVAGIAAASLAIQIGAMVAALILFFVDVMRRGWTIVGVPSNKGIEQGATR